jgi:hypothetical protein
MVIGFVIGLGIGLLLPAIWQNKDAIIAKVKEFFGQKFE